MNNIKITQDLQILKIKQESVFPIRTTDWERLTCLIYTLSAEKRIYHDLFSSTISVFITAVFALIAFYCTKAIPNWAFIITWTTVATSLLLSIVFILIDNQQKKTNVHSKENILEEIDRIEHLFESGSW